MCLKQQILNVFSASSVLLSLQKHRVPYTITENQLPIHPHGQLQACISLVDSWDHAFQTGPMGSGPTQPVLGCAEIQELPSIFRHCMNAGREPLSLWKASHARPQEKYTYIRQGKGTRIHDAMISLLVRGPREMCRSTEYSQQECFNNPNRDNLNDLSRAEQTNKLWYIIKMQGYTAMKTRATHPQHRCISNITLSEKHPTRIYIDSYHFYIIQRANTIWWKCEYMGHHCTVHFRLEMFVCVWPRMR